MLLRDYLTKYYAAPALHYLASILGICSMEDAEKMESSALIEQEANLLMTPEVMASRLSVLTDRQMTLFEEACREPLLLKPEEQEEGRNLNSCRYAFLVDVENQEFPSPDSLSEEKAALLELVKAFKTMVASNRVEVPEDVISLYNTVNTPDFQKRRHVASNLIRCLDVCKVLYGSTPLSVVRCILEQEIHEEVSEDEILSLFRLIPSDYKYSVYDDSTRRITDKYIQGVELDDLLKRQTGKDFYIPTSLEMEELYEKECLPDTMAYIHYRRFLEKYCGFDREEALNAAAELWRDIAVEKPHQECVQEMIDYSGADSSCVKLLLALYRNCYNETRFHSHCGHTPLEIEATYPELRRDSPHISFDMEFDDSVKTVKIGRNDSCPCGSGKKYKKCCMR